MGPWLLALQLSVLEPPRVLATAAAAIAAAVRAASTSGATAAADIADALSAAAYLTSSHTRGSPSTPFRAIRRASPRRRGGEPCGDNVCDGTFSNLSRWRRRLPTDCRSVLRVERRLQAFRRHQR